MTAAADLILLGARILGHPGATALATAGGRIVTVGTNADGRRWRGRGTRDVQCRGVVIPGLVDAHAHMDREGLKLIYPSLERCRSITDIPHRSLARHRIPFALATDNKPPDPWLAFRAVVARRDMASGEILGPRERLSRREALRALTVGGAAVTFAEREAGRIAPGFRADLVVLDRDPIHVSLEEIPSIRSRLTVVGGRIGHERRA